MGSILGKLNRFEEAVKHLNIAISIMPEKPEIYNDLGNLLVRHDKLDQALVHFTKAVELNPDLDQARSNLALTLVNLDNPEEADRHYQKLIQKNPNRIYLCNEIGSVFYTHKYPGKAIKYWRESIRLKPDQAMVLNNLAWILASHEDKKVRNPDEAVRFAERACELTKYEAPGLLDTLAVAYAAVGKFPEAIETAEKALELAQSANQQQMADEIQKHLQLYKRGQPYFDSAQ